MMDNGYEVLINSSASDSCKVFLSDSLECFICREGEVSDQDELRNFCDCKSLVAHHRCLLTWISKGPGPESCPRCTVCKAEYELRRSSAWRQVAGQWQTWLVSAAVLALLALVPFVVFRMMTAFQDPPPHSVFKAAAICFGLLAETLLIKCLVSYCSSRYGAAKTSSFSVLARSAEQRDAGPGPRGPPSAAAASGAGGRKQESVKASGSWGRKL
ncbi:uncharacterized protein [Lepisosteus oculatus]|uniref:uncharacterized protein n=1 Tax=Lepisosteus oculatus TaxID=7918 RepID=UPI00074036D8|nr:PREDICTED: uncharacterized protein LOC107078375 [Lepisosteus oculatus]